MHLEPSAKVSSIVEPWQRFRGSSSNGVNGMWSLGIFTRRKIKRRSLPGGWTSTRFFRSLTCVPSLERRQLLTFYFQKELTIDTGAAVPVIRHDVTNTHAVVSGVRDVVANTRTIVSESHRNALKSSDTRGQEQRVSAIRSLPVTE